MHASKGGYQKSCLELEKALGACHGTGEGWSNRAGTVAYESRRDYIIAVKGNMRLQGPRASRRHFGESR